MTDLPKQRNTGPWLGRMLIFGLALPSGVSVLLKAYGIAELHQAALWTVAPGCVGLCLVGLAGRGIGNSAISDRLLVGALGGLVGTFGYDVFRLPFALAGFRVFAPIEAYGVWLLDASRSSQYTALAGWAYHLSNGVTFGVLFSAVVLNRHWSWAVAWAILLEAIFVVSPLGVVFALRGNMPGLAVAFTAHVAYGFPLGKIAQHSEAVLRWLQAIPPIVRVLTGCLFIAALGTAVWPRPAAQSANTRFQLVIVDGRLQPDWIRIQRQAAVEIVNASEQTATVVVRRPPEQGGDLTQELSAGGARLVNFLKPGIYQVYIRKPGRAHSVFVIVEPVDELP